MVEEDNCYGPLPMDTLVVVRTECGPILESARWALQQIQRLRTLKPPHGGRVILMSYAPKRTLEAEKESAMASAPGTVFARLPLAVKQLVALMSAAHPLSDEELEQARRPAMRLDMADQIAPLAHNLGNVVTVPRSVARHIVSLAASNNLQTDLVASQIQSFHSSLGTISDRFDSLSNEILATLDDTSDDAIVESVEQKCTDLSRAIRQLAQWHLRANDIAGAKAEISSDAERLLRLVDQLSNALRQ
jgi:hypothetical protein